MVSNNGWNEYQKLVLKELEVLNEAMHVNREEHATIKEHIAGLRVKASIWGLFGGLIPVLIGLGILILKLQ